MPIVSFENLVVGKVYDRPELASMWGYEGYQAIAKGIVTPRNSPYIILFITKEKQSFLTQYQDDFLNGVLEIEGETSHFSDKRIIESDSNNNEVHLFYRDRHHSNFVYQGRVFLINYTVFTNKPSLFRFSADVTLSEIDSSLETEAITHGISLESFVPDAEGRKKIIESIQYERSRKNRKKAIELHGNCCVVCGFNFDAFYGADLARGFIEVHHAQSVTKSEGKVLDIENDLIPLCSNCHSMAHRRRGDIVAIEALKMRVQQGS